MDFRTTAIPIFNGHPLYLSLSNKLLAGRRVKLNACTIAIFYVVRSAWPEDVCCVIESTAAPSFLVSLTTLVMLAVCVRASSTFLADLAISRFFSFTAGHSSFLQCSLARSNHCFHSMVRGAISPFSTQAFSSVAWMASQSVSV